MKKSLANVSIKTDFIKFSGGLDTETPPLVLPSGFATSAQNFEQNTSGGYSTIMGYERFDGRTSPSSTTYYLLYVTPSATISVNDVITGATSSATATVIASLPTYLILGKLSGTFTKTETINVGGAPVGVVDEVELANGYPDSKLSAQYSALVADLYRADIQAVPGSGRILGIWYYNGIAYAFRNNAGGTAVGMYKSTSSGWSQVTFGRELTFADGIGIAGAIIPEGSVIVGATSGAVATVDRVVTDADAADWTAGDASGRLIISNQVGTFSASETINIGASIGVARVYGNSTAISFAVPDGSFKFINTNFGGGTDTYRMYGVDGKNRGFEFDGTVLVPIQTGMAVDAPENICAHKWHLFYSFFGSVQHSAPGSPYNWTALAGAGEIGIGDTVTGFASLPGSEASGALAIFSRNEISILYGTNSTDWNMVSFKRDAGAIANTVQTVGSTFMLDDRGITTLAATQNYGNFADATITEHIQSWINVRRSIVTDTCVVKDKNQYRLFFSDGSGLYVTIKGGKPVGMFPVLFDDPVRCVCSVEYPVGAEIILFGSNDGFVYQMERGTSFDGGAITCFLDLSYHNFKSPTVVKRYRKLRLEVFGFGYTEIYVGYSLDYGDTLTAQPDDSLQDVSLSPGTWDGLLYWDTGVFWDGQALLPVPVDMTGSGVNLAIKLRSSSNYFAPVKISGALVQYSTSRILR